MYCTNCGSQQNDGVRFCSQCGKSMMVDGNHATNRTSVFEGTVHKCPLCGEILDSYSANCPSCGHELRGINANYYVQDFTNRLNAISSLEEKAELIKNYAVPNSKEDLIEFIILASTNIDLYHSIVEYKAWVNKLDQIYQKFVLLISSGPEYDKVNKIYEKTKKKINRNKLKTVLSAIPKIGPVLPVLAGYLIRNLLFFLGLLSYLKSISIDSNGGNASGFELLGGILSIVGAVILIKGKPKYIDILIGGVCGVLSFFMAKFLDNGSALQLFGFITLVIVVIAFFKNTIHRNTSEIS